MLLAAIADGVNTISCQLAGVASLLPTLLPVMLGVLGGFGVAMFIGALLGGSSSSSTGSVASTATSNQSRMDDTLAAAQLNERVKAAMLDADALDEVVRCTLNSDYPYTDTAEKRYRYQAVFYLTHY